jgi:hypothetical protein
MVDCTEVSLSSAEDASQLASIVAVLPYFRQVERLVWPGKR